jgi:hypothetical protein
LAVSASRNEVKAGELVTVFAQFYNAAGTALTNVNLKAEIPKAFQRFYISLGLVAILAAVRQYFDQKFLLESKTRVRIIATGCAMALILCWTAFTCYLQFPLCGDDSYIDCRYVNNWIHGISFDYNPGERVLGFTSVFHVTLLALIARLTNAVDIDLVSQMINAFLQLVDTALVYFFLADILRSRSLGVIGATIFACDPYNSHQVVFGKEPQIALLFLILSLWSIHRKWYQALAWIACMLPFVRPEGIVWSVLCFLYSIRKESLKAASKIWAPPLVLTLLILAVVYLLFGTVIPHGAIAKSTMFYHVPNLALSNVAWMIGTGVLIVKSYFIYDPIYMVISFVPCVIVLLLFWILAKQEPFRLYMYAVLIYIGIYAVKVNLAFQWYLCWFGLVSVILVPLVVQRTLFSNKQVIIRKPVGVLFCAYVLLVQIGQQGVRQAPSLACVSFPWTAESDRVLQYRKAIDKMYKDGEGGPSTTIATPEIGMVGYRYKGKILDLVGLVSPQVIKYGPPELERRRHLFEFLQINPGIIRDMKPDYVIFLDGWAEKVLTDDFFLQNYREIGFEPNSFAGRGAFVYKFKGENQAAVPVPADPVAVPSIP